MEEEEGSSPHGLACGIKDTTRSAGGANTVTTCARVSGLYIPIYTSRQDRKGKKLNDDVQI
jgi:hypothetical protein